MPKLMNIVICTYNGEKYLAKVIESVLNQEELQDHVEKIIIVDNASTDSTKDIILNYQANSSKVEYIYEGTPGLSHARKHGALVNSEWVAFLDDDNILMQGWVSEAAKFIWQHPKIGVFNGASIATIRHNASDEELVMLQAIYKDLACTHYCMEDYDMNVGPAIKGPFGAGMVLKVNPLKKFLDEGWTNNIGRKGNELGSGEDGEIANSVLRKGFIYGYNNKMALQHIIPKSRLQPEYVRKLMTGLNIGYYVYISGKKNYLYYRMKTFAKSVLFITSYPFRKIFCSDKVLRLKFKIELDSRIRMAKLVIGDVFVLRNKNY